MDASELDDSSITKHVHCFLEWLRERHYLEPELTSLTAQKRVHREQQQVQTEVGLQMK